MIHISQIFSQFQVTVSGKIRGQRAKSMKFVDGLMIHSGFPVNEYIQGAVRHVLLRQGVLGLKVKIMLPHDPKGLMGPMKPLPDNIIVAEPKDDKKVDEPYSENKEEKKVSSDAVQILKYCRIKLQVQSVDPAHATMYPAPVMAGPPLMMSHQPPY
jgi:ribosomal protein S3